MEFNDLTVAFGDKPCRFLRFSNISANTHPENGNCSVYRYVGKSSKFDEAYPRMLKLQKFVLIHSIPNFLTIHLFCPKCISLCRTGRLHSLMGIAMALFTCRSRDSRVDLNIVEDSTENNKKFYYLTVSLVWSSFNSC
jgi:hypothetical protein